MQTKNSTKPSPNKLILKYNAYAELLESYLSLDSFNYLSPLTISSKRVTIISLTNYLGDNGIKNIHNCHQRDVTNYLISISALSSSTIS